MKQEKQEAVFFENQSDFRNWFEHNMQGHKEIWVGYYKKSFKASALSWSESVDVALCYGWIDGIRKSVDEHRYKIRFTPRSPNSVWSEINVKKSERLIELGLMTQEGLELFLARSDKKGYSVEDRKLLLSESFELRLKSNSTAWQFFADLAPSYKRESIWWVMSAKKPETRERRFQVLLESSHEGLKIPSLQKAK